jgi:hypothetical protein
MNYLEPVARLSGPLHYPFNLIAEGERAAIEEDERRHARTAQQIRSSLEKYLDAEIVLLLRVLNPRLGKQRGPDTIFVQYETTHTGCERSRKGAFSSSGQTRHKDEARGENILIH